MQAAQTESPKEEYERLLREKAIVEARKGLLAFTKYLKPDYRINWHHRVLCEKLDAFVRGDIRFLMVFMPPRHGKSELVSRRLPALIHGLYPTSEIFAASYSDSLAGDMTKDVQAIMECPKYAQLFPQTKIPPPHGSYTKGMRNTEEHTILGTDKGKYRGQGVGGSFTGKGANFIIIDDPIKGREAADSHAFREKLWNFWKNDLMSRLETDMDKGRLGQVLITLTRWHEDDLAGRLLEEQKKHEHAIQWDVVSYPAIKVDNTNKTDLRAVGEALWPAKYPVSELNKFKVDARAWGSLYQQNPVPRGGILFRDSMFRFGKMPEKFDWSFIMGDTAYEDNEENDFHCFTVFGVKDKEIFIPDVFREIIHAADVEGPAATFIKRHQKYGFRGAYIEPKGHGIYLNRMLPRAPHSCLIPSPDRIKEFFKDRNVDKVERANNSVPWLAGRFITINEEIPFKEELRDECLSFPRGKNDDFVDTVIDGVKLVFGRKLSICDV